MSRELYPTNRWTVGQWLFTEIDGRQISDTYEGRKLYGFSPAGEPPGAAGRIHEWFNSLEHAMAAAIAEKYTGRRGAGGTGVGTAADWFMRMIGADQLVEAGTEGRDVLAQVLHSSDGFPPVGPDGFARRIETGLENQGYVIAKQNHS
jgi:hypothetical protein